MVNIDIISDLHLDFYFNEIKQKREDIYLKTFDKWFKNKKSDILIIAGDLGHYNTQTIKMLKIIQKNYYKNIVCILGNHDYYLISKAQVKKYKNSLLKVQELRDGLNTLEGVYCLDGNVIEIDGIKIGGCDGWYDGEAWNMEGESFNVIDYWKSTMNDAHKIKGVGDFLNLAKIQKEKLNNIYNNCDVMVTHISPSIEKDEIPEYKKDQHLEGFYTFDGDKYLFDGNMQYWVFGHMHEKYRFEKYGTVCLNNPLGYPEQNDDFKIETIAVRKI